MNTTATTTNKTETIQTINQIGVSLFSLSLNETLNEKDLKDSFELINLLLGQSNDDLTDSEASNSLTK